MNDIKDTVFLKSRERITSHGEVFTSQREVNAMLDLVKHETERIESRFLEPACGNGNFLAEVLTRKLNIVETRYAKSQKEFERYAFLAVASIYGIDILQDNAMQCHERLFRIFNERYALNYKDKCRDDFKQTINFVLLKNIIWGDALTLKTAGLDIRPIVFSEWSLVTGSLVQRRDFTFTSLLQSQAIVEPNLFSDLGDQAFIPNPLKPVPPLTDLYNLAVNEQYKL
jgi:hypothetical protein